MKKPSNIWEKLNNNSEKYILEQDSKYVEVFNQTNDNENYELRLEHVPEPRVGSIDAPIYILSANPSFPKNTNLNCLRLENLKNDLKQNIWIKEPNEWWDKKLTLVSGGFGQALLRNGNIKNCKESTLELIRESLSALICTVEYFPYASKNYNHSLLRLPSQNYTFDLVRYAIEKKKYIIITRISKAWFYSVPELNGYDKLYTLSNPRNISITNNTLLNKNKKSNHVNRICTELGCYKSISFM